MWLSWEGSKAENRHLSPARFPSHVDIVNIHNKPLWLVPADRVAWCRTRHLHRPNYTGLFVHVTACYIMFWFIFGLPLCSSRFPSISSRQSSLRGLVNQYRWSTARLHQHWSCTCLCCLTRLKPGSNNTTPYILPQTCREFGSSLVVQRFLSESHFCTYASRIHVGK